MRILGAGQLTQHVSRLAHRGAPLHFGANAAHRFDCPDRTFGVLYVADSLATALMESVLHHHDWRRRKGRHITASEVRARMVRIVAAVEHLRLADLTCPGAATWQFGADLQQLTSRRYRATQRLSRQIHNMTLDNGRPAFDGICYPSRNNVGASCIALFDRASERLTCALDIELARHRDWPDFVNPYGIEVMNA